MRRDLTLDPGKATLWATLLSVVLLGVVIVPHRVLHDEDALSAVYQALGGWWFGLSLLVGIAVHEAIHGLTWQLAGGLRRGDVRFGVLWRYLMPYAHPVRPLTVRAYAAGSAAPGVLLGLIPAALGLAAGKGALTGWGAIFLAAAAGDLVVLYTLRALPAHALVQDHPTRVGCELVEQD